MPPETHAPVLYTVESPRGTTHGTTLEWALSQIRYELKIGVHKDDIRLSGPIPFSVEVTYVVVV